ncbi:APC10/DOC domain - like 2 [Theobroma cacao]|nr:APC10/DOC domain - like 2 [Theobroma cacao]
MVTAKEACEVLKSSSSMTLGAVLGHIGDVLPGHQFASMSFNLNFLTLFTYPKNKTGDGFHNLKEIKTVELVKPTGWVHLSLSANDPC